MKKLYICIAFIILQFSLSLNSLASPPEAQAHSFLRFERFEAAIKPYVEKGFKGNIIVATKQGSIFSKSIGQAIAGKANYTPSTAVDIASVSKQFTAAAIMKLVELGKLDTSHSISRYIKGVPSDKANITIHHLLTHSAGFKRDVGRDEERISRDDYEQKAMASELAFGVGEQYHYSNIGYSLLAIIVEKVSGQGFEDFLFENLLEPAGMFATGYSRPDWSQRTIPEVTRLYKGYRQPLELFNDLEGEYWNMMGSGGIISTAEDMLKWHLALLKGKVLSVASQQQMFSPHVAEYDDGYFYGYGWSVVPFADKENLVWHNGMSFFGKAEYWRLPEQGLMIFVASHEGDVEPWSIANALYQTLYK